MRFRITSLIWLVVVVAVAIVAWQRGHREGHKAGRDEGLVERWKLQAKLLAFEKHPPPPMYEQNQQLEATVSKLLE